jgi:glycosyltransferase involved in cell wall biosynthesis
VRIVLVLPYYDKRIRRAEAMLDAYPLMRELPAELAARGHDVHVFVHAPQSQRRTFRAVHYTFIRPGPVSRVLGSVLHRWKPRYGASYYEPAMRLVYEVGHMHPDVVHIFGMTMDLQLALLTRSRALRVVPKVVHFHGGEPEPGRLRTLQRHNLRRVQRVLFTATDQATPWIDAGVVPSWSRVSEVLETSSPFRGVDRQSARAATGMHGDPICLSTGRLHPIKDPLTMLRGFALIAAERPNARLYLYYLTSEMLDDVERLIASDALLQERVELRGRADPADMEAIYSSADFLLQASHREWSGLAVLEAMSCGCIPIISRIPSFVAITRNGEFGRLFERGSPDELAEACLSLDTPARVELSDAVRKHFHHELSFAAIARQLESIYADVISMPFASPNG